MRKWDEELWPLNDVKEWLSSALSANANVEGPVCIYGNKTWGCIAKFLINDEPVVFKGCKQLLFAERINIEKLLSEYCPEYVPQLLAYKTFSDKQTWTLNRYIHGSRVDRTKRFGDILQMVRTLASIQANVAALPISLTESLPRTALEKITPMLDHMTKRISEQYMGMWLAKDSEILQKSGVPENILEQIEVFRPSIVQWTEELIEGEWPISIDHLDFTLHNAIVHDDKQVTIIDWEQAIMSLPFFSLDNLLGNNLEFDDAPMEFQQYDWKLPLTPVQKAICSEYINT